MPSSRWNDCVDEDWALNLIASRDKPVPPERNTPGMRAHLAKLLRTKVPPADRAAVLSQLPPDDAAEVARAVAAVRIAVSAHPVDAVRAAPPVILDVDPADLPPCLAVAAAGP